MSFLEGKKLYPDISEEDWEVLDDDMRRVPVKHRSMVWSAILKNAPSAVRGPYFFIQRWYFTNVFDWPDTEAWVEQSVPCRDFPLSWVGSSITRPLIVGWREKINGIPYVKKGSVWKGDEDLTLSGELQFIESFERVGNDCYILYPYTKDPRLVDGIRCGSLTFYSHRWRRDSVYCDEEGVIFLLTDGNEYRVKKIPTIEVEQDGLVLEVQLDYVMTPSPRPVLTPVCPRAGKSPVTESVAFEYLARQVTFGMVPWKIEAEMSMVRPDIYRVQAVGRGDNVTLSVEGISSIGYTNVARIPTSAKILIQNAKGRFLMIKEGKKPWDLPGGKGATLDEKPSDIIRREVLEEIDVMLPPMDWKLIRRTEFSLAFLYHAVVPDDFLVPTERYRWFDVEEFESLSVKEMVYWLPDLLRDALTPGQAKIMIPEYSPYHLLVLAQAGDICYSPTIVVKEGASRSYYDYGGNRVVAGRYATPVVPYTMQYFPKLGLDTQMVPWDNSGDSSKVSRRARDQFKVKNGFDYSCTAIVILGFLVRRFGQSFMFRYLDHSSRVSYWGKHLSVSRMIMWYDLANDQYGICGREGSANMNEGVRRRFYDVIDQDLSSSHCFPVVTFLGSKFEVHGIDSNVDGWKYMNSANS